MNQPAPSKSKFEILLGSPVAAALITILIGSIFTNLWLSSLQKSKDLKMRQFEIIHELITCEADYKTTAEFVLFDFKNADLPSDPGSLSKWKDDYRTQAQKFITEGNKQLAFAEVYLPDSEEIRTQFDGLVMTEGDIANMIAAHKPDQPNQAVAISSLTRAELRKRHTKFLAAVSEIAKSVY